MKKTFEPASSVVNMIIGEINKAKIEKNTPSGSIYDDIYQFFSNLIKGGKEEKK